MIYFCLIDSAMPFTDTVSSTWCCALKSNVILFPLDQLYAISTTASASQRTYAASILHFIVLNIIFKCFVCVWCCCGGWLCRASGDLSAALKQGCHIMTCHPSGWPFFDDVSIPTATRKPVGFCTRATAALTNA